MRAPRHVGDLCVFACVQGDQDESEFRAQLQQLHRLLQSVYAVAHRTAADDNCVVAISYRDRVWLSSTRKRYERLVQCMLRNISAVQWISSDYLDPFDMTPQQAEGVLALMRALGEQRKV